MGEVKHYHYQFPQSMMPGSSKLKPGQGFLWMMIWSWSKEGKPCFMSNARFARDLNLSERQVKNILKQLKDMGLVKVWYESINGSSKKRCLRAVLKPSSSMGNNFPQEGAELPHSGQEVALPLGSEVPFAGEVSFTHTRIDTTSTTTSSIKEEEGSENEVMLLFSQLGKNAGVSVTTVKEWYQSFSSDHLKNGVWVDKDGHPLSKVKTYAAKNFQIRLENTKQNAYQQPRQKPDVEKIKRDISYHMRRAENWSKNPEKQHLAKDELQYVKYLEHQLQDIL